jgi:hypothetical protein
MALDHYYDFTIIGTLSAGATKGRTLQHQERRCASEETRTWESTHRGRNLLH